MVIGIAAAAAAGAAGPWAYAPLAGWDVAALSYTGWLWLSAIAVMTAAQTATHAICEDPSRAATGVIAAVASLAAVGFILIQATSAKGAGQDLLAGVGVLNVARLIRAMIAGSPYRVHRRRDHRPPGRGTRRVAWTPRPVDHFKINNACARSRIQRR